jgi:hypothetical protein
MSVNVTLGHVAASSAKGNVLLSEGMDAINNDTGRRKGIEITIDSRRSLQQP